MNKMKKLLSMALALVMVCSLSVGAFAATTGTGSVPPDFLVSGSEKQSTTTVKYVGQGNEEYSVTVPATLAPGASDTIAVTGTWASNHTLRVTVPSTITLTKGDDSISLAVTFAGITQVGNDFESIDISESISVANFAEGDVPLFGTWTGTITYTAGLYE